MILLIRKWIAWLALAVIIAGASIYWAADEWQLWDKTAAVQVLSQNVTKDKADAETDQTSERSVEEHETAQSEQLSENVVGSTTVETDNNAVLNEELRQTGAETNASTWREEAEELKWERQTQLAQEYDELKYLAQNGETSAVRIEAQERMLEIKNAQSITEQAESMLQLKGFEAVVFVEGQQISALIDQSAAQSDGVAVAEILERVSGFAKENVLVIPR